MPISLAIALVAGGEPFSGDTPETRALGGSETACVQMARALAGRGHRVSVFCHCPAPGEYHGVIFRDLANLVEMAPSLRLDVLVVSRAFALLDLPISAGLRVLWNHDVLDRPSALAQRLDAVDLNLVLSRYHADNFAKALPACARSLVVTRNGLDLELIEQARRDSRPQPGRLTYVSRPERGLKLLLESIWPRLRAVRPELELLLCGYRVDPANLDPRLADQYAAIARLVRDTPGVTDLGPLEKPAYYRHLASCAAVVYPCVFPEISCIAALEAQALGTPIITTDGFALAETVVAGEFKVPGRPGSAAYVEGYVQRVLELLEHPGQTAAIAEQARRQVVARHDWAVIAAQWEELFLARLAQQAVSSATALAASLVVGGAREAAAALLQTPVREVDEGPAPPDPQEEGLLASLAHELKQLLQSIPGQGLVGVISADQGRTAAELAKRLKGVKVREINPMDPATGDWQVVVIRDRLEREPRPADLLERARTHCRPDGRLLLCVAAGAWPLVSRGFLARRHDLGERELSALLAGRPARTAFLPRGLVGSGAQSFYVGRWLVSAPAAGAPFGRIDPTASWRDHRPAPPALVREVSRAGLI